MRLASLAPSFVRRDERGIDIAWLGVIVEYWAAYLADNVVFCVGHCIEKNVTQMEYRSTNEVAARLYPEIVKRDT